MFFVEGFLKIFNVYGYGVANYFSNFQSSSKITVINRDLHFFNQ